MKCGVPGSIGGQRCHLIKKASLGLRMRMLPFFLLLVAAMAAASNVPRTKEIAPGVAMPFVNCGGVHSHPSNFTDWIKSGGRGLDTAMM